MVIFIIKRLFGFIRFINKANFSTLAGSLSFYIIVNIGSLFFLVYILSSYLQEDFLLYMFETLGLNEGEEIVEFFYSNAIGINSTSHIWLFITSIWSSSTLFFHLLNIGELIFVKKKRPFKFFKRITAIIMVFVVLLIFVSAYLILFFLVYTLKESIIISGIMLYVILPIITIYIINFVAIPRKLILKKDYKGILLSYVYCLVVVIGFQIFLSLFSNFKAIYGILSLLISIMFLIYLVSQGLIIGMIYNYRNYH